MIISYIYIHIYIMVTFFKSIMSCQMYLKETKEIVGFVWWALSAWVGVIKPISYTHIFPLIFFYNYQNSDLLLIIHI